MDCIICGNWFSSVIHDGACPTCSRAIKQLGLNMAADRLQELAQAEKDGRLVVLPCKVGDTVWTESPVKGMVYSFEAPDIAWIIESADQFGKEIFLTREEAEAALKKREDDNEAD